MQNASPERLIYGISADEAHRFGLPCGGTIELMLEFNPCAVELEALVASLREGKLMERRLECGTGRAVHWPSTSPAGLRDDGHWVTNTFGPEYRMLLIGAGQLAEYLSTMALFSGFMVTVCDPREEHLSCWSLPDVECLKGMPDDVVRAFRPDRRSCVIALSHDPKLDDLALLDALETEAFYIGAIGSRRNSDARRARMIAHFEQTPASLARLRGPIGLYIGSKTPAEIAVSVMAEVLAVKNEAPLARGVEVGRMKDALAGAI
ncbi:xanthine dehydrogenase accessory factor [Pseudorhodoferax soli]|uniref:Xanthine dehydrogenase accessory factor n=2 Tax=Pseudorhodoferax soli TaxID=545864 RepID=A0A368XLR3_9BURK|nr:xanthine dehydrogenase accessory factor [Pseudorhodoferax soli]